MLGVGLEAREDLLSTHLLCLPGYEPLVEKQRDAGKNKSDLPERTVPSTLSGRVRM